MSVLRTGVHGVDCHGVIPVTYMGTGALGLPPVDFDEAQCVFTEGMAKRDTSGNVFAASPMVQGDANNLSGLDDDTLIVPRGNAVSGNFYDNLDTNQGSIVFWWTPEYGSADLAGAEDHRLFTFADAANLIARYEYDTNRFWWGDLGGSGYSVNSVIVAGTAYSLIFRWDLKNTLDGTNYACLSINGVHSFGITNPGNFAPRTTCYIGNRSDGSHAASGIIEGLTIYRRPLWDGDYGVDVGNGDEVALISAGVDPCTVTGSWDIPLCVPTNAAVGALVTGTGEAWSHPHAAAEAILTDAYCQTAYAGSAWGDEGTPVTPAAYEFDGAATLINCGSNAALDDLPSQPAGKGTFTAEAWIRADGWGEFGGTSGRIFDKTGSTGRGWFLTLGLGNGLRAWIYCATTNTQANSGDDDFTPDGRLHHVAMTWDDLTFTYPRLWVDGIEVSYSSTTNRVGAVVLDNADDFIVGNRSNGDVTFDGKIAWSRLSNNIRYASPFVPPPLTNPPAVDGNTVEQWNFTDCAGASVTASVNAGAPPGGCDGQITAGAGGWNCSRDMDDFAIGDRIAQWGYIGGADAANEGFGQTIAGLAAGQNYVLRVPVNLGADSNGRARIRVRDITNAANIVDFDGPLMTGTHTGANNSPTLIVAGARFPQSLIGTTVYNMTDVNPAGNDCGKGIATSISGDGTTITFAGGLSGGTDNDFDTGDTYRVVQHRTGAGVRSMPADHPWTEPFTFELPTIARNGTVADCVSIRVMALNSLASGTVLCHQVEIQENLVDNPSMEAAWVGGPPAIPAGWNNDGLDPGDIQTSSTGGAMIHSGAEAAQWNAGAVGNERLWSSDLGGISFIGCGGWLYGDGTVGVVFESRSTVQLVQQASLADVHLGTPITAVWNHIVAACRSQSTNPRLQLEAGTAGGTRYTDDVYAVLLDDVTLTATAANQADSAEATGLRVDGRDTCVQPIPAGYWAATSGWMRWEWTPRHDAAQLIDFYEAANQAYLLYAWGNATNYILVFARAANTIRLQFDDGGGPHTADWACAGQVIAGATYLMEVRYTSGAMWLLQDGVERARITTPLAFAVTPTNVYWGSRQAGDRQVDASYNEP